ncbi:MAG: iron ABC transporter permease [Planctomycetaceae bacterium]|nr:iron ABC transporter permease [Planctomycetaceae bacterium]
MSRWTIPVLLVLALAALAIAPFVGMEPIPLQALWSRSGDGWSADVLWQLRIPRVIAAFLAGAALSTSGMSFQAMFRNPLATPFTLGVSSGASLGAAVCIQQQWIFLFWGVPSVTVAAFLGAVASIAVVYALTAGSRRGSSTATMLLAGVAVSFFFSSLILFLQYISDFTRSFRMLRWVMGGLEGVVTFGDVLTLTPFVVSGSLIVWYLTHELNLLCTGEEFAHSRGVEVRRTKLALFFAVSLMIGAVVSVCGPIGFVGLVAPHICRLLVGPDHRRLLPASWLFGGTLLVVCDTAARTVMAPTELPAGILTALLGGPFFLWLLLRRRDELGDL